MANLNFSEALHLYLKLKEEGPDETSGYTDKTYYRKLNELEKVMDKLAPGRIEVTEDYSGDFH